MAISKLTALIKLARFHFLIGTSIAYLVGALIARNETGELKLSALALGALVVWLVQLTTQFLNEYFDQATDRLNRYRTPFSGGSGVLLTGALNANAALWAGIAALLLAVMLFLVLTRLRGQAPAP